MTKEAFRDGWFYPGDCGHLSADGELFVTGRLWDVHNLSGIKFNIAEVDGFLKAGEAVEDALCFTELDENGEENLAALILLAPGVDKKPAIKALIRTLLAENYAMQLLPRNIYQADTIPRSPNGKALRHEAAELVMNLKPIAQVGL